MKENVANFIEDLSQRDFVVFAGAGVSEITKIPTWRDLLTALERRQKIRGVDIKDVDSYLFPEIAQMLFVLFQKEDNAKEYYKIIRDEIQPKAASQTILQQEIILATSRIVTTNYDDTFERAFKKLQERGNIKEYFTFQTIAVLEDVRLKKKNLITYLHGRFDETSIIFKTTDYESNYSCLNGGSESALEKLLRHLYKEETLIFVGFSFDDRYISRTIERIYHEIKDEHVKKEGDPNFRPFLSEIKHYALLEDISLDDEDVYPQELGKNIDPELKKEERIKRARLLDEKLESMHIKTIRYEYGKHLQLEDWFNGIQRKRATQRKVWVDKDRQDDTLPDMTRKI